MVGFYSYISLMCYELLFCESCYIFVFHLGPSMIHQGSQIQGAMLNHSGIDRRNSFNSNGLFDWREAKGLFKVSLFVVELFGNGGVSNHGIHHAHTQLPLEMINKNLREINAYALKTYKHVRYNQLLAMLTYKDIYERIPEPKWYDYVIQALVTWCFLCYCCILVTGLPIPPPVVLEYLLVDYRFHFYATKEDISARFLVLTERMQIQNRKKLLANPNYYLVMMDKMVDKHKEFMKGKQPPIPISPGLADTLIPPEVEEFNILKPMELLKKKAQ